MQNIQLWSFSIVRLLRVIHYWHHDSSFFDEFNYLLLSLFIHFWLVMLLSIHNCQTILVSSIYNETWMNNLISLEFRTIILHHHMMITYDKLLWWNSLLYSLGIIITHNHCFLVFRSFFAHSQPVPASKPCVSPGCDGSGPIQSAAQKAAEAAEEQVQDN